jgi:hypothetical protein
VAHGSNAERYYCRSITFCKPFEWALPGSRIAIVRRPNLTALQKATPLLTGYKIENNCFYAQYGVIGYSQSVIRVERPRCTCSAAAVHSVTLKSQLPLLVCTTHTCNSDCLLQATADPQRSRALGLRRFVCWDCVFEPRRRHRCPSVVSVGRTEVSGRADHSSRGVLLNVVRRCV